jgi:hypothetical protein
MQKIKNNNLDLLSLIREMAILRHLPGNVESVNILYNLFWECDPVCNNGMRSNSLEDS